MSDKSEAKKVQFYENYKIYGAYVNNINKKGIPIDVIITGLSSKDHNDTPSFPKGFEIFLDDKKNFNIYLNELKI